MSIEQPVHFEARGETLLGIRTIPGVEPTGAGLVVLSGGRYGHSAGRNRISWRMAQMAAARGLATLRFDYHGVGDSTGHVPEVALAKPFTADAVAAARVLIDGGAEGVVLVGDCFGARTGLAAALELGDRCRGLVTVSLPWRDIIRTSQNVDKVASDRSTGDLVKGFTSGHLKRAVTEPATRAAYLRIARVKAGQLGRTVAHRRHGLDLPGWVSRGVVEQLREVSRRHVPVLAIYGRPDAGDDHADDFATVRDAVTADLGPESSVEFAVFDTPINGFRAVAAQDQFVDRLGGWLDTHGARVEAASA